MMRMHILITLLEKLNVIAENIFSSRGHDKVGLLEIVYLWLYLSDTSGKKRQGKRGRGMQVTVTRKIQVSRYTIHFAFPFD